MDEKDVRPEPPAPATSREPRLGDQELARRDKLRRLAEAGVDIFPHRADLTHRVSDVVREFGELSHEELEARKAEVRVPGRIMTVRKMGKATFFHISDGQARLQAYIRADVAGAEAYERFGLLDIGDVLLVAGTVFKTRTGELSVLCASWTFLAKCLHPLPEKWHGLQDVEIRFRRRYLDLIMNPEVGRVFRLRSAIVAQTRRYFDDRGFMEVETPMMQSVAGGAMARPFKTFHNALGIDLYLRIAPELFLKRLTVGGLDRVYEINRCFRNEGVDAEHNPEFTTIEWYQAYADHHDMMELTEDLIVHLARTLLGKEELAYGEHVLSLKRPFARLKFRDACVRYSGLAPSRFEDPGSLIEAATPFSPDAPPATPAKALEVIFDKLAKPRIVQPTFILNPPKEVSPLAKSALGAPDEAARFELMVAGMEIANAFSELTDPAEQKARFEQQAEARSRGDEETHPVDTDYVEALEYGLPPTGGEGIGIDRLTMLFANRTSIRDVILFPLLKPRA